MSDGNPAPQKTGTALQVSVHVLWPNDRPSQLLLSSCLSCKSHRFKTGNIKFYPQILSTDVSFHIYERHLTGTNMTASVCALNLQIRF